MQTDSLSKLPVRIKVQEIVSSRYENGKRPLNWDLRKSGEDVVKSTDGKTLKLFSEGGQSPPQKDWVILVNKGDSSSGYTWTLYSI